jgi:hypothetical protein
VEVDAAMEHELRKVGTRPVRDLVTAIATIDTGYGTSLSAMRSDQSKNAAAMLHLAFHWIK